MQDLSKANFLSPPLLSVPFAEAAVKKALMTPGRFVVFALLGGMFIAIGGLLSILVAGGMPGLGSQYPGIVKFAAGAMFPIGLVLVVVAGGGLFTSDCATLPMAYWQKKITLRDVARIGLVGYLANFAGALLVAWLLAYQSETLTKSPWKEYAINLAFAKTHSNFWTVFVKGIGANLMVCLAVWMANASKDITGKVLVIWMPVMAFVALGWEHSIANMFFIPLGMMMDSSIGMKDFLVGNLFPSTLGNIVGGALFVALPYFFIWGSNGKAEQQSQASTTQTSTHNSNTEKENLWMHLN